MTEDKKSEAADVESTAEELDEASTVTVDDTDTTDDTDIVDDADTQAEAGPATRSRHLSPFNVAALVLAVALVAAGALTAWLYLNQYRLDQQTDDAVTESVLAAAKDGTVSLLSYSPESLEQDFTTAKSHLTGDFRSYYTQFTQDVVTPAAKQKSVKTTASVVQAAVADLRPSTADVLVFVNQNTTSAENPDGSFAVSSVKVGLTKINGAWLISAFDPV